MRGVSKQWKQTLLACDGVVAATVNLVTEMAAVEWTLEAGDPQRFAKALTDAGFPSQPRGQASDTADQHRAQQWAARKHREQSQQLQQVAIAIVFAHTLCHWPP